MPAALTFLVPGTLNTSRSAAPGGGAGHLGLPGRLKASVRVAAQRAGQAPVRLSAVPGEDVVVLHLAGGPALVLHPEHARDLMLAQSTGVRRSAGAPDEVRVPAQLHWAGLEQATPAPTRGLLGQVLLQAVEVLTGLVRDEAADFVASQVVARVDGQVNAGVYALAPDALAPLKGHTPLAQLPAGAMPLLVLLHGTFVDTASTFAHWWTDHPGLVRQLFTHYQGRVFALDHPTLGASPITNALTLARSLPQGARLHLVTHSRGGLVAEVLARVAGLGGELGADELAPFAGAELAGQRAELLELAALVKARGVRVERVVRVACPARGTLLASRRLDAYVSVLRWTLQLAGVPVAPALLGFLAEVARRREDPGTLPGLAAMVPDSALVRWLNRGPALPGELRVVAGDLEGDSLSGWLKTLLADAFYWTDNDIVVQTRSMYGGSPRTGGASFLLDQGGRVNHFNYFANTRTAQAVADALTLDQPGGFAPIGPLSWAGQDSGGLRAPRAPSTKAPAERPAVFVLPGILGSHLRVGGRRIWLSLNLVGSLARLAWHEGVDDDVHPDGPIGLFYDELIEHLGASHEVIPFAFDWRRPIEQEARRLAAALGAALDAREASGQPVRLLAHSMGGVLARTVQLEAPDVWQRLMARDGARLLMLGTPNAGSWAPMQVLSGDDDFGNLLAAIGAPLQDHEARALMAAMPGFMQLMAGLEDGGELAREATWRDLAKRDLALVHEASWWHHTVLAEDPGQLQLNPYRWGVPPQAVLDQALALRKRLDAQARDALPAFAARCALVVGHAPFTPQGWQWSDRGLVYVNAGDGGDGRVEHRSARLPGVRSWSLDAEHGDLPCRRDAFDAYVELLQTGTTGRLTSLAPMGQPGEPAQVPLPVRRSRPSRQPGRAAAQPPQAMRDWLRTAAPAANAAAQTGTEDGAALTVRLLNGDLCFVRQPLMLGHYRSPALTGTEAVVDRMVGGALNAALDTGLYPQAIGSHQVFVNTHDDPQNPWQPPRPQAAIVVGLGDEGGLKAMALSQAVAQATLAWLQRLAESREGSAAGVEMAATLLGSGGLGVSPGDAACAIAAGVREASERVRQANLARRERDGENAVEWPLVTRLTLVELYLSRATEAWRALQVQATAAPSQLAVEPAIASGTGPLRRQAENAYRGTGYELIRVGGGRDGDGQIEFRLDTRRARTEVRAVATQAKLVREMVRRASHDAHDDPQLGHTLFQLLVPQELENWLGGSDRMVLELDQGTAAIPWELLDPPATQRAGADRKPWAVRSQLLRKLRHDNPRPVVRDAWAEDPVLVVGEPALDKDGRYADLPGARAEARAVAKALRGAGGAGKAQLRELVGAEATTVINALFERAWRIVHIAGHGEPPDPKGAHGGGVVLSGGVFLGPAEIAQMRTVPELVFVNCCHLAGRDSAGVLAHPSAATHEDGLAGFAANVADALIAAGVRCVIAAGWAVEDEPAALFAQTLYAELLAGRRFIEAVARAREAAWREAGGGNTWAAYQCYGDPDWVLRRGTSDAQGAGVATGSLTAASDAIASPLQLALALEQLAVQSKFQGAAPARQLDRLRHLEARFGTRWGGMGAIAEAFGIAYGEARDFARAVAWLGRAVAANDASASIKAMEQWLNLRVRHAAEQAAADPTGLDAARAEITEARARLLTLAGLQPSIERLSLCGSAAKRLALLAMQARDRRAAAEARAEAALAYGQAEQLAREQGHADLFYPALNRVAGSMAAHGGGPAAWPGFDPDLRERLRASLLARVSGDPDFWSLAAAIELDAFESVAVGQLGRDLEALLARAADLHARVRAPRQWASVADTADFALAPWAAAARGAEREALKRWCATLRGWAARA